MPMQGVAQARRRAWPLARRNRSAASAIPAGAPAWGHLPVAPVLDGAGPLSWQIQDPDHRLNRVREAQGGPDEGTSGRSNGLVHALATVSDPLGGGTGSCSDIVVGVRSPLTEILAWLAEHWPDANPISAFGRPAAEGNPVAYQRGHEPGDLDRGFALASRWRRPGPRSVSTGTHQPQVGHGRVPGSTMGS